MRITLVRHGETTGRSSIRFYGATDVPLSEVGKEEMRRVGIALAGERFDAVFTSQLRRAREAAAIVAREGPAATTIAAFDEVDFGNWEGWTREEIAARDPANYSIWQNYPLDSFTYPGGESRQAFTRRVAGGLSDLLDNPPGRNMLMVVHRGVIAVILTELLQLSGEERNDLKIDLASIHVVCRHAEGWRSECLNRTDHLRQ